VWHKTRPCPMLARVWSRLSTKISRSYSWTNGSETGRHIRQQEVYHVLSALLYVRVPSLFYRASWTRPILTRLQWCSGLPRVCDSYVERRASTKRGWSDESRSNTGGPKRRGNEKYRVHTIKSTRVSEARARREEGKKGSRRAVRRALRT
jgi:hypothetical protein